MNFTQNIKFFSQVILCLTLSPIHVRIQMGTGFQTPGNAQVAEGFFRNTGTDPQRVQLLLDGGLEHMTFCEIR